MIASGVLDAADAAAMLDKLSVDAADRVMAALPPNVAERTAALVASDEIRARAAARAVVHLASSHVSGPNCETCIAGREAAILLESANPGGGRLTRGGAHVVATFYFLEPEFDANGDRTAPEGKGHAETRAAGVEPVVAKTVDLGTGAYEIRYEITRAGRYHLELTTAGQSRVLLVTCEPDVLDPPSCAVEAPDTSAAKRWRAGEQLELRVFCRDRFGNAVFPPDAATSSAAARTRESADAAENAP